MSGVYIGVDGKARKVKGGYIGIDGVARKIKKGYIGVDGVARLCWVDNPFDPVFANNSWEQIALVCQTGAVPDSWAVGDQKTMTIGGTDYTIDIIGKNHDDYADGSGKAPLTFQFHNVYASPYTMNQYENNATGWVSSYMRQTNMEQLFSFIPVEIQAAIKTVTKKTSQGNENSNIVETEDKLFLLSEIEVFGRTVFSFAGEGNQYDYYKSENRTIKTKNNQPSYWWLRSPRKNGNTDFCIIGTSGDVTVMRSNYTTGYAIPAFCF